MAKIRIVEQDQQEHIKNERSLLMTLSNDFIVKCYQSFRLVLKAMSEIITVRICIGIVNTFTYYWMHVWVVKYGQCYRVPVRLMNDSVIL